MSYKAEIGKLGERLTAAYLKRQGYIITRQNYRCRYGEIDIVAEDSEYILFVEVKTREKSAPISPQGAVSKSKMKKIIYTAREYLAKLRIDVSYRFDIAEVTYEVDENGELITSLNYIKNAFNEEVLQNQIPF